MRNKQTSGASSKYRQLSNHAPIPHSPLPTPQQIQGEKHENNNKNKQRGANHEKDAKRILLSYRSSCANYHHNRLPTAGANARRSNHYLPRYL
jgi:hypothetical protein